jgi:hypothetical protein
MSISIVNLAPVNTLLLNRFASRERLPGGPASQGRARFAARNKSGANGAAEPPGSCSFRGPSHAAPGFMPSGRDP